MVSKKPENEMKYDMRKHVSPAFPHPSSVTDSVLIINDGP